MAPAQYDITTMLSPGSVLLLVSLTIRQWGVMRKVTYLVPESVILLVLGCLLGLAGNLIYNQKINCLLPR